LWKGCFQDWAVSRLVCSDLVLKTSSVDAVKSKGPLDSLLLDLIKFVEWHIFKMASVNILQWIRYYSWY